MASAVFEYYKNNGGDYEFVLRLSNGIVLQSEVYKSKVGCLKGIESVRNNSHNPDYYVKGSAPNGKHRFTLQSTNGRILLISQDYSSVAN